ncbi:MAG: YdcF family protein [Bacteroidetes bacterium]|nr:YdcF family protein [Bacteroidota bacterium]
MPQNKPGFFSRLYAHFRWPVRIGLFFAAWILIHVIYITIDGLHDRGDRADVAIILGNAVYPDGSLSPWLKGRVDAALKLYREGRVKKIFASGGIGMSPDERGYPEGDGMKKYLVEHGVPAEDVIADNYGRNTYLTAKDFIAWNKDHHYTSAIVVSQFYHITRTKYILRHLGFQNVGNATSRDFRWGDAGSTLREVPAFYKDLIVY